MVEIEVQSVNRFAQQIEVASEDVLGILRDARALIADEKDWAHRGVLCDHRGRVCAIGAVMRARGVTVDALCGTRWELLYGQAQVDPAVQALARAASTNGYASTMGVWLVNDEGDHAKVLALFDKAIASLEVEFAGIKRPRTACDGRGHDTEGVIFDASSRLREGVDGRAGAFRPVPRRAGTPARRSRHITGLVDHQNR